jgi:hypothetical protein
VREEQDRKATIEKRAKAQQEKEQATQDQEVR